MGIELRMPSISGNEREQLVQIRSYLYQLIPQLQWALNNVNATGVSNEAVNLIAQRIGSAAVSGSGSGGSPINAEITFAKLKPLIIKSADIVQAYYEEINKKLEGVYVAESDFGTFMEQTKQEIKATSTYTEQKFNDVQVIITNEIDGLRVTYQEDMGALNTSFSNALGETDSRITEEVKVLTSAIDTKIDGVNEKIDDVNASIANTDGEIVNVNARIDETNEAITETNSRIDDTNEKITAVENAIDDTNTRIDTVNASIAETNEEIRGVNSKIDETNGKIDGLSESIESANSNIDILIEAKDLNAEDVVKLNNELSKINGSISEINTNVESIEADVNTIDGHVKEVDGQIVGINTSVANIETLTTELNGSVAEVEDSITNTNAKVDETTGAVANLKAAANETREKVEDLNNTIKDVNDDMDSLRIMVLESRASIKTGIIDKRVDADGNEFPVYGIEIGQIDTANGDTVLHRYARFTSGRLSFYDQNDDEVAYISDYKLFIRNVEITISFKIGGLVDTVTSSGDVVTKWVGKE